MWLSVSCEYLFKFFLTPHRFGKIVNRFTTNNKVYYISGFFQKRINQSYPYPDNSEKPTTLKPIVEIDENDAKILRELIKDARTRLKDIAKVCNLSSAAILTRIKRLRAKGVITGTVLFTNMSLLGYTLSATIEVNLPPNQEVQLINSVKNQPNIELAFYDVGGNSLLLFLVGKSIMDIDNLKQTLKNQLGTRRITVSVWGTPTFCFESINIEPTGAEPHGRT